ncbi:hypothetical protein AM588_10008532 [Phytophthora nicotianae]|uniref:Kinesin-like protein n=1 Tax=Phytophthora nicotianae TaxID=4792 RepID=A0A0W8DT67_PHYNI|nr:hypothetical protein AM588_10008532 [Phytophthora nicotianae]
METIFEEMARIDPTEYDVALTASFVEVYQEKLRDLLLPHSSRSLRLREDKEHDVRVEGASEITISSVAGGMAVLSRGNAQRSTGSTFMNADSSRSHSVLILTLTKKHIATGTKVRGKLFVVDLAGSEKVQKTAATGVRMEEAKHINRTSLGGNAKTHLLLTCSASIQHLDETLSTLRFGSRAKNIQNNPHVNKENAGAAAEYSELLTMLQRKIENLHSYIRQLEMTRCEACKSRGSVLDIDAIKHQPIDDLLASDRVATASENPTDDADDFIADELVRAEMQSLRMALTTMMRDHETQEHAHRALMDVTEQQLESRHRSQEQIIHQQQRELQDASATISQLEKKLELLEESARGMSTELHRLRGQQHQYREGENAETEILRRQLDASTKLSKQLQAKLSASRQEHEDVTNLNEKLMSREHELNSLRSEMEVLRVKKLPVTLPSTVTPGLPSPLRTLQTRPVTAVDFKTLTNTNTKNAGMNNIHNWWAGLVTAFLLVTRTRTGPGSMHLC